MGQIRPVEPVKLFVGMLYTSQEVMYKASQMLEQKFGTIDIQTPVWNFEFTNYYAKEMGAILYRKFIAFRQLAEPQTIKDVKLFTNTLESELGEVYAPPTRPINLDPGYLNNSKVVLATTKDYSHRIYLGNGIYAEVTLHYQHGKFCAWDWTYPDYQTSTYQEFFMQMRCAYRQQLL